MPRIKVDNLEPDLQVEEIRDPRFPLEMTTDEELRQKSGGAVTSSFCAFPTSVHFSGEHNDEEIILLLRAHLVTLVPRLLLIIILAILPIAILPVSILAGIFPSIGPGFGLILVLLWYLGLFTYGFLNILYWYFNVGIITSERIVDVDWNSVTNRDVATAMVSKIEDVKEDQIGALSGVFDFGSVYVETAGNEPNIEFLNVPHPQLVIRKIQELMAAEDKEFEHNG